MKDEEKIIEKFKTVNSTQQALALDFMKGLQAQVQIDKCDKGAIEMEDRLIAQYANAEKVTDELKKLDPKEWISRMNNIKCRVREVVQHELIYVKP